MFRASSAHHQESLTVHEASSFLCLCLSATLSCKKLSDCEYECGVSDCDCEYECGVSECDCEYECGVSECDCEASTVRRSSPTGSCRAMR
jgi:hypothetical protein